MARRFGFGLGSSFFLGLGSWWGQVARRGGEGARRGRLLVVLRDEPHHLLRVHLLQRHPLHRRHLHLLLFHLLSRLLLSQQQLLLLRLLQTAAALFSGQEDVCFSGQSCPR